MRVTNASCRLDDAAVLDSRICNRESEHNELRHQVRGIEPNMGRPLAIEAAEDACRQRHRTLGEAGPLHHARVPSSCGRPWRQSCCRQLLPVLLVCWLQPDARSRAVMAVERARAALTGSSGSARRGVAVQKAPTWRRGRRRRRSAAPFRVHQPLACPGAPGP